jgi:hypothetical protein
LFSEFTDAIIVFIALQALLPTALEMQYVIMQLNRNVFMGHVRDFCLQMKHVALFNHIDLGHSCLLLIVRPSEPEKIRIE